MENDGVKSKLLVDLGYTESEIKCAIRRCVELYLPVTLDNVIDQAFENITGVRPKTYTQNQIVQKLNVKQAIEQRKNELREAIDKLVFMCKMCHCAKADILLLPCAHVASCDDCLMDIRRCPIPKCNKIVRGTKQIFLV